jgi:hypothetical protein
MNRNRALQKLSLRKTSKPFPAARVDVTMAGEIVVHFGFGEADDFRREFDKRQAALPHEIINRPPTDIRAPGNLRLGFVIRRGRDLIRLWIHGDNRFQNTLPRICRAMMYPIHQMLSPDDAKGSRAAGGGRVNLERRRVTGRARDRRDRRRATIEPDWLRTNTDAD